METVCESADSFKKYLAGDSTNHLSITFSTWTNFSYSDLTLWSQLVCQTKEANLGKCENVFPKREKPSMQFFAVSPTEKTIPSSDIFDAVAASEIAS